MLRHDAFPAGVTREGLVEWYRAIRARTRALFDLLEPDAYYDRPVTLRNPIVFYEGHLPGFAVNTLVKLAHGRKGVDERLETLFARGIDPEDEASVPSSHRWPSQEEVQRFAGACDELVEDTLRNAPLEDDSVPALRGGEAVFTILEHELMHQETLSYLLHELPYEKKRRPASYDSPLIRPSATFSPHAGRRATGENDSRTEAATKEAESSNVAPADEGEWATVAPLPARRGEGGRRPGEGRGPRSVEIPPGDATLGADRTSFGWDNEFPSHRVHVDAFEIDVHNVTNGDWLEFMEATGARAPHYWARGDGEWCWRGMFELLPLALDAPVYVTHVEAEAYARWKGKRLPAEAEFHRAAYSAPDGSERLHPWGDDPPERTRGNFNFASFEPVPVGSHPAGASAWGVHDLVGNGWEWTSTLFGGFEGFEAMPPYRQYSTDFFDRAHYVLKGASPATARELVRRSFRNWFRPNYPYVYATFRCVR